MPVLILLIFGVIVAVIAHSKGRNPVGWFFIGFLAPLVGLIVILILSDLNEEKAHRARMEQENRRLREQLRQERLRGETFRDYTMRRLDVHDERLGIDTRSINALPAGEAPLAALPDMAGAAPPPVDGVPRPVGGIAWYYEHNGETRGPVSAEKIRELISAGTVGGSSLLWAEHLPDWTPAEQVDEFRGTGRS